MEKFPDEGVVNHRKRMSKCDKGNVVKQTVEMNPADEHPGICKNFFFFLMTCASRNRQSSKFLEYVIMKDKVYLKV